MFKNVDMLSEAVERGVELDFLFFWGHHPRADGRLGTSCFSQWWPSCFEVEGRRYSSAEQFMMAGKARLFGDEQVCQRILNTDEPAQIKKLGRQVSGFVEEQWQRARFELVVTGNVAKFGQNDALGAYLLGTGDKVLAEASPTDRIWGIGLAADDPRAQQPQQWPGENLLGFALMVARAQLRSNAEHGQESTN